MNEIDYKSIFEQTPVSKMILDKEFNIITVSNFFLKTKNSTRESIIGKNIFIAFPQNPADKTGDDAEKKIQESFKAVLKNKMPDNVIVVKYDLQNSAANGGGYETKYWRLSHSPIFDEAGNVKFITQISEDVTENETLLEKLEINKKMLGQIEESNQRYFQMLMDSPFAFSIMKGEELMITLANKLMKDFWGKGDEVEGKTLLNLLPELEDQTFPEMIRQVLHTGVPVQFKEILAKLIHNGVIQDRYFNIVYQPYHEADHSITGVTTIAYEVTEMVMTRRKIQESEIFSRSILESSPDCIKIIDTDGKIEFINERGLCLLEIDDITKVQNKYWWELWEQEDKPMIQNALTNALSHKKVHFQATGYSGTGSYKWWDVIVLPLKKDGSRNKIDQLLTVSRDITDYKNATLKIIESEHQYNQMIYSSPYLIAILRGDNFIIEIANDAILESWEKGKDVIGKSLLTVLPEIVGQGFDKILSKVFDTGITFNADEMPVNLIRKGQMELTYFSFVYQALKNVSGTINGISIIANEVTPWVKINKQIKEREQQFSLLVEQAPVAICVLRGKSYIIETINEPMVQMWNRKMEEVINKPAFDVLPELKDQGFKELLDNVYDTGIPFVAQELPINLQRNNTLENAFVKFVYEPLRDAEGIIIGVMALAIEITEQVIARKKIEESEKHFRQLADLMPSKISNADVEGKVLYMNQKWEDYTGKTFSELKDLGYYNIIHPDEQQEFLKRFEHASKTATVLSMEIRILNKFNEYKWHLNLASPVIDEQGKITMWVGSTTEIHEQITQKEILEHAVKERTVALEFANNTLMLQNVEKEQRSAELGIANSELAFQNEEKEKRSDELVIANKELHTFTYVASHDLQEPLRKIQTFASRIIETELGNLTDTGKDYFRRMQASAARMQQLIDDLLAFSKTNTSERKLELINLNIVINEVKTELKDSIEDNNAIIEVVNMCEVKIIVFQFRQLMFNLISNSIKFSLPGIVPHIIIDSRHVKGSELNVENIFPKKMYCHISLKDNGIGFEEEYSKRIFEVFQRLHSKEMYKGTGIGLAIVKKIVDNHNGIITATSKLGEGATFDIYLPV